jgi:hypothetical protein
MDEEEMQRIRDLGRRNSTSYSGQSFELVRAFGLLEFGFMFGYDALRICNGTGTVAIAEKVLGFKFIDVLPRRTDQSHRIAGIRMVDAGRALWSIAKAGVPGKGAVAPFGQRLLPL